MSEGERMLHVFMPLVLVHAFGLLLLVVVVHVLCMLFAELLLLLLHVFMPLVLSHAFGLLLLLLLLVHVLFMLFVEPAVL
jgi:hypothetical protein